MSCGFYRVKALEKSEYDYYVYKDIRQHLCLSSFPGPERQEGRKDRDKKKENLFSVYGLF
jgi:hypothetical protein